MTDVVHLLSALESANDPVETIRSLVLEHAGLWCDPEHATGIFEIQLAGFVGLGSSALSAVEDWQLQVAAALGKSRSRSALGRIERRLNDMGSTHP